MSKIMYIGSFAQLLKVTFGDTIREEFIEDNLPSLTHDYENIKKVSPNICSELNYEYLDGQACIMFINKWRKILKKYNKEHSDFFNPYKNPLSSYNI